MKYLVKPIYKTIGNYCYCGKNSTACNDYNTCTHIELPEIPMPPKGK